VPIGAVVEWATAASVAVLVVAGGVYALLLRAALNDRFTVELLPSTEFDPDPAPILLAATQLARARRAVTLLPPAATALRITLAGAGDGLLRYRMSVPGYARAGPAYRPTGRGRAGRARRRRGPGQGAAVSP
jgi:hypothetical protein